MNAIAKDLGCGTYTGKADLMTRADKDRAVESWLSDEGSLVIAATSALRPGLDYAYVRWVVHVEALGRITDLSQESGWAGCDGEMAASLLLALL